MQSAQQTRPGDLARWAGTDLAIALTVTPETVTLFFHALTGNVRLMEVRRGGFCDERALDVLLWSGEFKSGDFLWRA